MANSTEKALGVIPARYASTRLPGKPLADIAGKPMIVRVLERARQATSLAEVVVATDDARIVDAVERYGGKAVMTPESLASGTDRVAWVASRRPADIVVNIQGDEPFLDPAAIDAAVALLVQDPAVPMGTLVRRLTNPEDLDNPNAVKVVRDAQGFALYFSRSAIPHHRDASDWLTDAVYYQHVGLYVYRRDFLLDYRWMTDVK